MEFGKFPWGEILQIVLPTVLAYFTGRYRSTVKNKGRRSTD
jgi:hypothetical protein